MAKRFTDTDKWKKKSFRKRCLKCKCFWFYLLDTCDNAGIWEVDFELASFCIGEDLNEDYIRKALKDKIKEVDSGKRWFIPDFLIFQYGELKYECRPHRPVIEKLKKYSLLKDYQKGIERVEEQDKDKEQEQDKALYKEQDKEKDKEQDSEKFGFVEDKEVRKGLVDLTENRNF